MKSLSFEIEKKDPGTDARLGLIKTKRGNIETPYFVPVATLGCVRALDSADLAFLGVQSALANTYHLHLRPGDEIIKRMGGLHRFMAFSRPLFSDSGGFQAFSMGFGREHNISKIGSIFPKEIEDLGNGQSKVLIDEILCNEPIKDCDKSDAKNGTKFNDAPDGRGSRRQNLTRISDEGISFKSQSDGTWHFLDAKKSMEIQSNLDSDIIMAFDECTSPLSNYDYTKKAMQRTHDWAIESLRQYDRNQAIYGIIQGGWFEDLRMESAEFITSKKFDGIAVGGSLGNCKQDMHQVLDWVGSWLDDRPRHLLGIGEIDDIFEAVQRGIDTFDCVSPTRIARRGSLFISPPSGGTPENKFRINIKSAKFRDDPLPVDNLCKCPTCVSYSRAYLKHLYDTNELSYFRMASMHNLFCMLNLMGLIRGSIRDGSFLNLKRKWLKRG